VFLRIALFPFLCRFVAGRSRLERTVRSWKVASPGLVRSEVAVLRPHVASPCHVTASSYSRGADQRITQMQYICVKCN